MIPTSRSTQTPVTTMIQYNLTELKFEDPDGSDSESSSLIWVILFSILMLLSILSNVMYIVSMTKKSVTTTHIIISIFFIINLIDYSLLVFEFSLGSENQFTYPELSCSIFQFLQQLCPLATAVTLVFLVLQAAGGVRCLVTRQSMMITLMVTLTLIMILLVPSLMFSEVAVYPSMARFCVIDISGVGISMGMNITNQHIVTAVYTIIYKSVLSFWLPSLIVLVPVIKMFRRINSASDKHLNISLSISIAISFIVFNMPLATVSAVR